MVSGLTEGLSTDLIISIRRVTKKVIEYNKEVHICFIDLEKSYDSVPRKEIWSVLWDRGDLITRIRKLLQ